MSKEVADGSRIAAELFPPDNILFREQGLSSEGGDDFSEDELWKNVKLGQLFDS